MKIKLFVVFVILLILAVLFPLSLAYAQGCGTECFFTPTPTPTEGPTPTPGAGTPTAVPLPPTVSFPQINYGVPTPIPTVAWPGNLAPVAVTFPAPPSNIDLPIISTPNLLSITSFTPPTIPTPSSISLTDIIFPTPFSPSLTLTDTSAISITPLVFTVDITHDTLLGVSVSMSDSQVLTGAMDLISNTEGTSSDIISFTSAITEGYLAITATETITVINAPAEYVPDIPRTLADVGYTLEQLTPGADTGQRFTIASWGGFLGYLASLPIQLIKSLWVLGDRLGPFSLFLGWLLILAGFVVLVEILRFVWHFVITIVDILWKIWESIPFVN